jgi:hypothetical protein
LYDEVGGCGDAHGDVGSRACNGGADVDVCRVSPLSEMGEQRQTPVEVPGYNGQRFGKNSYALERIENVINLDFE